MINNKESRFNPDPLELPGFEPANGTQFYSQENSFVIKGGKPVAAAVLTIESRNDSQRQHIVASEGTLKATSELISNPDKTNLLNNPDVKDSFLGPGKKISELPRGLGRFARGAVIAGLLPPADYAEFRRRAEAVEEHLREYARQRNIAESTFTGGDFKLDVLTKVVNGLQQKQTMDTVFHNAFTYAINQRTHIPNETTPVARNYKRNSQNYIKPKPTYDQLPKAEIQSENPEIETQVFFPRLVEFKEKTLDLIKRKVQAFTAGGAEGALGKYDGNNYDNYVAYEAKNTLNDAQVAIHGAIDGVGPSKSFPGHFSRILTEKLDEALAANPGVDIQALIPKIVKGAAEQVYAEGLAPRTEDAAIALVFTHGKNRYSVTAGDAVNLYYNPNKPKQMAVITDPDHTSGADLNVINNSVGSNNKPLTIEKIPEEYAVVSFSDGLVDLHPVGESATLAPIQDRYNRRNPDHWLFDLPRIIDIVSNGGQISQDRFIQSQLAGGRFGLTSKMVESLQLHLETFDTAEALVRFGTLHSHDNVTVVSSE